MSEHFEAPKERQKVASGKRRSASGGAQPLGESEEKIVGVLKGRKNFCRPSRAIQLSMTADQRPRSLCSLASGYLLPPPLRLIELSPRGVDG
jgi:hypothetical protein